MGVKQDKRDERREAVRVLINEGYEPNVIARKLDCSVSSVQNDLKSMGLQRSARMAARKAEVQRLVDLGMPHADIAVRLGLSLPQVKHDTEGNGTRPRNYNSKAADTTAAAQITRILQTLEPLGPALHEALDRLEGGAYDYLVPDQILDWQKVVDDTDNIGKAYRRLRRFIKEKRDE